MTPEALARVHSAAFVAERAWTAQEFAALLASPHVQVFTHPAGFALTRTVVGESELLTLAVDPAHQRQGVGRHLIEEWIVSLAGRADTAFLEVASDNEAAQALYAALGFTAVARRPAYYARKNSAAADAIVMQRPLTLRQSQIQQPDR
ncbi:Ribosomal-protein-alanine acetyltransferase [Sulfitobacter noctilucae]|uniref:ribosomal protein S18-alanine N-acetyltransferase n=1 Tax=Sulfitobacter noctilucae TaxID=1342302 RepID=UPI00046975EF|nr:ribosomal protein S18-alanine N-acetyltransferase [Sulfitobacter noctilucae]KIN60190.1 Ribosomal-protein-alanine acetyltransferase [Sulfitobacter noctilucae]